MIRGTVSLPHGTGKNVRVAVFAAGRRGPRGRGRGRRRRRRRRPRRSGSRAASSTSTSRSRPRTSWARSASSAASLGPRGLMPNPKTGTVTNDVGKTVARVQGRQGRVPHRPVRQRARADRQGQLRRPRPCSRTTTPCSTRSSGPSRPRRRAASSGRSSRARRWARRQDRPRRSRTSTSPRRVAS